MFGQSGMDTVHSSIDNKATQQFGYKKRIPRAKRMLFHFNHNHNLSKSNILSL